MPGLQFLPSLNYYGNSLPRPHPLPTPTPRLGLNYQTRMTFSKAFNQAIAKTFFNAETFRELLFQNLYRSMLVSLESDRQIIPTLSGFISNHTNIYYQTMEGYHQTMVDTLFSDFYCQNSAKRFTK